MRSSSSRLVTLMAAVNDTEPTFTPGIPRPLLDGPYLLGGTLRPTPFDVFPDGQRFLMIKVVTGTNATGDRQQINVVLNWFEELKERVPIN